MRVRIEPEERDMTRGGLFSRFFLQDGIRDTDDYRALDPAQVLDFADAVRKSWRRLEPFARPSEAETESSFVFPVLRCLGWHHLPQQTPGKGRQDVADALLFLTEPDSTVRGLSSVDRFRHGVVVVENEARDTLLDRASGKGETPSGQIVRYLGRAEGQSGGAVRWGLLTNARFWRLYYAQARSKADGFIEFDLPGLLGTMPPQLPAGAPDDHWLRVFLLLFRRDGLVPHGPERRTFLDEALAEGRHYEARVTRDLSEVVFKTVFPELVKAIGRHDPAARRHDPSWRAEVREAALRLLFRLLFVLYAEDRDLLPVHEAGYVGYSLQHLRDEAARVADSQRTLPARTATWWPRLRGLFDAISAGDGTMGLPPYNGGLFHDDPGSLLHRLSLPDAVLAPLLDRISREGGPLARRWINYRDLSAQHLGSIYERLLEQDVVDDGADLALRPNAFARKTTGSYYTPEELVHLIIRRAIGPLLAERRERFAAKARELERDTRRKADRLSLLVPLDPAEAFLQLRVCDPAMGSGHFLVSLVDYLARETLDAIGDAPELVKWGDYRSPLLARIAAIRDRIRAQAADHGWPVREEHLDDRHIVRRIILKRCVYGVDLNPMAVELAKLSLWLHSFTVGAPLSFLDHHLRCGDSLFGEFVGPVERDLRGRYGFSMSGAVVAARNAAKGMAAVEETTDADIAEVEASATGFAGVEKDTAPLRAFLNLYHSARWLADKEPAAAAARGILFGGGYGDPVALAAAGQPAAPGEHAADIRRSNSKAPIKAAEAHKAACDFLAAARTLAQERRFLHWEVAFPGVWEEWERPVPSGGFDAVIGNPPWDRMKMQEVEWFAARIPAIAAATKAADRKGAIETLRKRGDAVAADYDHAAATAETAARVARELGARSPLPDLRERDAPPPPPPEPAYPLLSGGDVNVYALFVERAARLVRADGIVGLLVPSGIAADLGAAPFFRSISTSGRLAALLDFENGKRKPEPFFPDVHRSFKFLALVFGGSKRTFAAASCAFFKQSAEKAEDEAFALAPADFAAVNPNTGTAPVFRTPRDAEITKGIYARLPVLVDRRETPPRYVWPVRYLRMFDMTNDSAKFRTEAELRKLGAYEVQGQRWEKGSATFYPLMVGRSFHQFDHRAASVVENPSNTHNPFNSRQTTDMEHADAAFIPRPQFWVSGVDLGEWPAQLDWAIAFRDIARPTDVRTVIAAIVPRAGCGNKAPLLLPDAALATGDSPCRDEDERVGYRLFAPLLVANLNALVLDFVARQKVQATNLNLYILEQLPVVPLSGLARRFGTKTAEQIVRDDVLALTYTAHDLAAFAADTGHTGPPFRWNAEDRLRRRARLDALFFHLYGLNAGDADYVMGTFPIVRQQEEATYGRFRTRELVLNYMAALAAGNPDANVAG
jgi:predicted small lipoprotein YifL